VKSGTIIKVFKGTVVRRGKKEINDAEVNVHFLISYELILSLYISMGWSVII
jgi:hypothetical protein